MRDGNPGGTDHATSVAEAVARLDAEFPAGTIVRNGAVAGAWRVTEGSSAPVLQVAWVTRAGRAAAFSGHVARLSRADRLADRSAGRAAAMAEGEGADGPFGGVVRRMAALAGMGDTRAAAPHLAAAALAPRRTMRDMAAEVSEEAVAKHLDRVGKAVAPFLATLDRKAIAVDTTGWHTLTAREWEGCDETFTPGAPLRAAISSYPFLQQASRSAWKRDGDPRSSDDATLRGVITRELARSQGLPPGIAARLRDAHDAFAGSAFSASRIPTSQSRGGRDPMATAMSSLGSLPPNWIPQGRPEWDAFWAMVPTIQAAARLNDHGPAPGRYLASALACGGRWARWREAVQAAAGRGVDPAEAVDDVEDMVRALFRQVAIPACSLSGAHASPSDAGGEAQDAFRAMALRERGLRRMLEVSATWHRSHALPEMPCRPGLVFGRPWVPFLPDHASGDLRLTVLTTAAQIADEGRRGPGADGREGLHHCVGTYADDCRRGDSRIASIGRAMPDGTVVRVSTVEFMAADGAVDIVQHRGMRNGPPPADAAAFASTYAARRDVRHVRFEAMPGADEASPAGYDWALPGNWEAVARSWRPYLPRRFRDMDQASWATVVASLDRDGIPEPTPKAVRGAGAVPSPRP